MGINKLKASDPILQKAKCEKIAALQAKKIKSLFLISDNFVMKTYQSIVVLFSLSCIWKRIVLGGCVFTAFSAHASWWEAIWRTEKPSVQKYPWIGRIGEVVDTSEDVKKNCTASLVSKRVVLTAAHCVSYSPLNKLLTENKLQIKIAKKQAFYLQYDRGSYKEKKQDKLSRLALG